MRLVVLAILVAVSFSGCTDDLSADWDPEPASSAGLEEIARAGLAAWRSELANSTLYAMHAVELLELGDGAEARRTLPLAAHLLQDDRDRLDGRAFAWMFYFEAPERGFVTAVVADGRVMGTSHSSGGPEALYDHVNGGTALTVPSVDSMQAAAILRQDATFEDLRGDPSWDIHMMLQHWNGRAAPVWVFEAVSRDSGAVQAVVVDAITGERVESAVAPSRATASIGQQMGLPNTARELTLTVPDVGFDRLEIQVETGFAAQWEVEDPSGAVLDMPYQKDPRPGTWIVRVTATTPIHPATVATLCLDEEPPERDGGAPSPCERALE